MPAGRERRFIPRPPPSTSRLKFVQGGRNGRAPSCALMGRVAQDKITPLYVAAQGQHLAVVQALIEAGAEVDVECGDAALTEVRSLSSDFRVCLLCRPAGVGNFASSCTVKPRAQLPPSQSQHSLPPPTTTMLSKLLLVSRSSSQALGRPRLATTEFIRFHNAAISTASLVGGFKVG